ncbi:energy transducer TonB [uncultured Fusobacterium sp.]|jgi:protein TonB|uniref:energy transducer TonB n=1 Tax=uncultured Fusobacterium sp. TaxID=159267 RepID=UPI00258B05A0|nr:energy transducer TonB [uncultured Fusobacterium sp.]
MRFYIISFVLHIILLGSVIHYSNTQIPVDSKNVVVYLNELNTNPVELAAAPPPKVTPEKIEEKKPVEKKKIVKKEVKKKALKRVKKSEVKENIKEPQEDKSIENATTDSSLTAPQNPFSGMGIECGTYVGDQRNMGGYGYKILREVDPKYPQMAKKAGFKQEVVIKTKFLVGINGKVEKVVFLDNFDKYGFHLEVEKALKKWEFAPIIYHGEKIKMYFYKDFRFNVKTI